MSSSISTPIGSQSPGSSASSSARWRTASNTAPGGPCEKPPQGAAGRARLVAAGSGRAARGIAPVGQCDRDRALRSFAPACVQDSASIRNADRGHLRAGAKTGGRAMKKVSNIVLSLALAMLLAACSASDARECKDGSDELTLPVLM